MKHVVERLAVAGVLLSAISCSTTIEGRVTREGSSSPVSGARVQIGEPYGYTDSQGRYKIAVDDEETYDVIVTAPSFQTQTQQLRVGDVDDLNVDFALDPEQSLTDARREGRGDVRIDVQSTSETAPASKAAQPRRAPIEAEAAKASSPRENAGALQGRVRQVEQIEFAGHSEWRFARVTMDSGDRSTLAFAEQTEPAKVGVVVGAEVLVEGRYAQVKSERVLIVERLIVDGATRLNR